MLKEIRIHGRGGQGAVTLAELIAIASFYDGKEVQAFPSFGVERRGAPVESYVRISNKPITRHDQVRNPDFLIILDETLLTNKNVYRGLDKGDLVIINSSKGIEEIKRFFKIYPDIKIYSLDAVSLGMEILGKPIVNTALLGAFAAATKLIKIKAVEQAIREKLKEKGEEMVKKNVILAQKAFDHINPKSKFLITPQSQEIAPYSGERMGVTG